MVRIKSKQYAEVTVIDHRSQQGRAPKIGYILKRFPRFSETFILNEILELERQGVEVEVFSLLHPPQEPRHDFLSRLKAPITYLPRGGTLSKWNVCLGQANGVLEKTAVKDLFSAQQRPFDALFPGIEPTQASHLCLQASTLAMLASARGIAHLHAHFGSNATTVALLAGRLSGIPFSYTAHARDIYHTYVDPRVDAELRRRKIAEAQFVVTVSDYNRRHLVKLAGDAIGAKVQRLYNGIDLSRFQPDLSQRQPGLFLAVGRLVEKKGFRYLVEACRILSQGGHAFRCLIVGEGPERDAIERQIKDAGLDRQLSLVGGQPQETLIETMRRASAVVLPCVVSGSGDRDGLPTVLLEGMAMGLPTISTTVAGIPEIIDHRQTGFLVEPADPQQLASAMLDLLSDPRLGRRLGDAGRAKAERLFDLKQNVAVLRRFFSCSRAAGGSGSETDNEVGVRCSG